MATERDNARIPVSVLTGFLGSGKTTLLRRLLTDPGIATMAVRTEHAHLSGEDERACHGEHDHRRDRHVHLGGNHSVDIQSFSLRVEQDIDWTAFGIWLTLLLHRHGANILRVKGLLRVPDAAGPIVLHGVQRDPSARAS
jgi:G3E family GTPase